MRQCLLYNLYSGECHEMLANRESCLLSVCAVRREIDSEIVESNAPGSGLERLVVILQLRGLEHARDAERVLALRLRELLRLLLLLLSEQLRVVCRRELLELDQEVARDRLVRSVRLQLRKAEHKRLDLRPVQAGQRGETQASGTHTRPRAGTRS